MQFFKYFSGHKATNLVNEEVNTYQVDGDNQVMLLMSLSFFLGLGWGRRGRGWFGGNSDGCRTWLAGPLGLRLRLQFPLLRGGGLLGGLAALAGALPPRCWGAFGANRGLFTSAAFLVHMPAAVDRFVAGLLNTTPNYVQSVVETSTSYLLTHRKVLWNQYSDAIK